MNHQILGGLALMTGALVLAWAVSVRLRAAMTRGRGAHRAPGPLRSMLVRLWAELFVLPAPSSGHAGFDPSTANAVVWRDCSGCGRHDAPHEDDGTGRVTCVCCASSSRLSTDTSEDDR